MEADLQLQLGHIRSKKDKVSALAADLQRVQGENNKLEPKLTAAYKKKDLLERDLHRLQEMERAMGFEVDHNLLRSLDNPMESDILTATEYQEKMEKLLELMNELLVRTVANYKTAHAEQEEQERDFGQRTEDAIQARNMLTEELAMTKLRVEEVMSERIKEYEMIKQLENALATADAEIWLTRADSHRISDQLALLSTKPSGPPCRRTQAEKHKMTKKQEIRVETVQEIRSYQADPVRQISHHEQSKDVTLAQQEPEILAFEDLQSILPQILGMVANDQKELQQQQPPPPPPPPSTRSAASSNRPFDVTKIARNALRMFNLDLE